MQPGQRTVAAEVVNALQTVLREPVDLAVAGRTDRGVHALGQVVSYHGPLPNLRGVNALLPREIVALRAETVPDGFSARHDARSRTYRYRLLVRRTPSAFERGRALWWPHSLDVAVLEACAAALPGTHDFTAFTPTATLPPALRAPRPPRVVVAPRRHPRPSRSRPTASCAT